MVGGLVVSQMLTLFSTPVVYLYLDRAHYWYMRRKAARGGGKPPPTQQTPHGKSHEYMGGEGE